MVFKLWDAINEFVGSVETFVRWMAKALVPKDTFSLCTNSIAVGGV